MSLTRKQRLIRDANKLAWVKGVISRKGAIGLDWPIRPIEGIVCMQIGVGVSREWTNKKQWALTHLQSGLRVGGPVNTKRGAMVAALVLSRVLDFTKSAARVRRQAKRGGLTVKQIYGITENPYLREVNGKAKKA